MKDGVHIRLTAESRKMLTELQSRWPLLRQHAINRYALENGLRAMMSMPTLLPAQLLPWGTP